MDSSRFNERDHLAWSRFMLLNVAATSLAYAIERDGDAGDYLRFLRERLGPAWRGLGAQGVEGAMLSMLLTLEAMGCQIKSTQTSPENSEIVVEHIPGTDMLDGMVDRFDVQLNGERWLELMEIDQQIGNQIYDILGAIADGAGIEFVRGETDEGDVRIVLRAW
jgi:hypothetical protein